LQAWFFYYSFFSCPPPCWPGWPASPYTWQWPETSQSRGSFLVQNKCFISLRIKIHAQTIQCFSQLRLYKGPLLVHRPQCIHMYIIQLPCLSVLSIIMLDYVVSACPILVLHSLLFSFLCWTLLAKHIGLRVSVKIFF
jgi:hypothetical protein